MNNHLREDQIRVDRTKQELDAGLREKILAMRVFANTAHAAREEIETIIREKDLDRHILYAEA